MVFNSMIGSREMNRLNKLVIMLLAILLYALPAYADAPTAKVAAISSGEGVHTFRDCEQCPEMVHIPSGTITMGSSDVDDATINSEDYAHLVRISSFSLGKTEVTRAQFAAFVNATHYKAANSCWTFENGSFEERGERSWRYPGFPQHDNHPVLCLNLADINAYAQWLSRITGRHYRLPTGAEWQYAAELGTMKRLADATHMQACVYANVVDAAGNPQLPDSTWVVHSCTDGYGYTSSVNKFDANTLGLRDMIGNDWEWTQDCNDNPYNVAPSNSRANDSASISSEGNSRACKKNVLRGGSWYIDPQLVHTAYRIWVDPVTRNFSYGFRLAVSE
jgi:formylglycine-generating enzyme required for sulfatase activity